MKTEFIAKAEITSNASGNTFEITVGEFDHYPSEQDIEQLLINLTDHMKIGDTVVHHIYVQKQYKMERSV